MIFLSTQKSKGHNIEVLYTPIPSTTHPPIRSFSLLFTSSPLHLFWGRRIIHIYTQSADKILLLFYFIFTTASTTTNNFCIFLSSNFWFLFFFCIFPSINTVSNFSFVIRTFVFFNLARFNYFK